VARFVALVRGINVGRAKRVAMSDLRRLLQDLDYAEVRTILNSGNVVFSGGRMRTGAVAKRIEAGLSERLGVSARVVVLTAEEFATVVGENGLGSRADRPERLLVAFCDDASRLAELSPLGKRDWGPEGLALGQRAAYLWCADGILASPLAEAVGRVLRDSTTARNWATVLKIQALLEPGSASEARGRRGLGGRRHVRGR
jgi:uncharacterized protein (DUF1697 family)